VEGGELRDRKDGMPKKRKENPLATYILVIAILMVVLSLIFPAQLKQFVDALYAVFRDFSRLGQVLLVLILIGLVVYLLRRLRKI